MDFTFGIITQGDNDYFINIIIDSIIKNNIPNYEIIIVGKTTIRSSANNEMFTPSGKENETNSFSFPDKSPTERILEDALRPKILSDRCNSGTITVIDFDETIKPGWTTKKKNIIFEIAKYENIVVLHDYIKLSHHWYEGFIKFGNDYEFCVSKIINVNGSRYRDYTLFPYKVDYLNLNYSSEDIGDYFKDHCLLPYDFENNQKTNKYLYISGAYFIIKKRVALKHKMNENLIWGKGEDVEYSKRLHNNGIIIKCNSFSEVMLLKYKEPIHWEREISKEQLLFFTNYCSKEF
jgi:hypothetical protein